MSLTRKPVKPKRPATEKKKRFAWWTIPVIIVCLGALVYAYGVAEDQLAQYDKFNTMRAAISQDVIYGPVYIDDVLLTGMTMDEARQALTGHKEETAKAFEVTIAAGDSQWHISSEDVPMTWNTEALLQKAYMIGRSGTLEQRYGQVTQLSEPVKLYSQFSYNKDAVRKVTDAVAINLAVDAVDASVVAFDVVNRTFAFSDEQYGQSVDAMKLYQTVISHLDNGQYGSTVQVETNPVAPKVTRAELEPGFGKIASFTTKTTDDSNRNNNIKLAADAFNGKMILPGETISFNETTGQRLPEKGYKEAGAIENGRTVQEVGGGVCQVSSTLFNALIRANCEIVSRKPHAWPSDYVPRGEDATVDWPNLDLVMRNASNAPMFITAWYQDRTVTIEVYGYSLGEGVSIGIESETTYTKEPTEVVYTYNEKLPVGTTQLLKKPRTGYSVQTYKIWYQNGVETSREKFYTSDYRMISEEYEYNDGKPPETNP